jgi:hypothetical protein
MIFGFDAICRPFLPPQGEMSVKRRQDGKLVQLLGRAQKSRTKQACRIIAFSKRCSRMFRLCDAF